MNAILEFLPFIAFFVVAKNHGVVMAAAALMASAIAVSVIQFLMQGFKLEKKQWFILIITVVFCSLTVLFRDEVFIKWKATIIDLTLAAVLLGAMLMNKLLLQMAGKDIVKLSDRGWKRLTWVFIAYFVSLASLHYFFAFYTSEDVWIDFKVIWSTVYSFVFMIGVMFALRKHIDFEAMDKKDK